MCIIYIVLVGELAQLKLDLRRSLKGAYAMGTWSNLKSQWKAYWMFTSYFGFQPLPATTEVICLFMQFLSRSFSSPTSIKNYVHGVHVLHQLLGLPFEHHQALEFRLAFRGIKRLHPHVPKKASPMDPVLLQHMFVFVDLDDPVHMTYWCVCLMGFFLMLRISHFTSQKSEFHQPLKREDIQFTDSGAVVCIRWSKTKQFGGDILKWPLLAISGSPLCPVAAYKRMCTLVPLPQTSLAFQMKSGSMCHPITAGGFQCFLRKLVACTGNDPLLYSTHSLRRGGATWAFQCGVSGELIQKFGGWKSDAYKGYLDVSLHAKGFALSQT